MLKQYEAALSVFKKDPADYFVSDPKSSRAAIAAISPGTYKIIWSDGGVDCGYREFILDGDYLLEVDECKFHYVVRLYRRKR